MKVKTGSTIELTVNGTDTEVSVPFVTNYSEKESITALKDKNLMPQVIYVENTKTPKGYVIDTFPKAGAKVTIGSDVFVYVANGARAEQVTIPSVEGKKLSDVKAELTELKLTVETVYDDESKEPKDTVLYSSPLPYGKVDAGTVVTLTVSSGKYDKKTVDVFVDLPSDVDTPVDMTVIVDGVVDSQYSKTVVPIYNKTYTLKLTGTGTSTVVVQLDGTAYREYTVDFTSGSVTNTVNHEYNRPTEPQTEPPTEAPTQTSDTEPTTLDNYDQMGEITR